MVLVTKLNRGQDYEARFGHDLKFKFSQDADVWLRFLSKCLIEIPKLKFDQDLCKTCDINSSLGSVVPLAMFLSQLMRIMCT